MVVQPPQEAVAEGIAKWESSLVGQFLDTPLPFWLVKRTVDGLWGQFGKVKTFSLDNGLFLFKFKNVHSRDNVIESRIWHVANKTLILRKWKPGMQPLDLSLIEIPIWIKILRLPLEYWNSKCLSYIASGVGKPLFADANTESNTRLGFARVFVEVDVNAQFPEEIEVDMGNGHACVVGIEYPWIPIKCSKCCVFGHLTRDCATNRDSKQGTKHKRQWVPKHQHKVRGKEELTDGAHLKVTEVSSQHPIEKKKIESSSNRFNSLSVTDRDEKKIESSNNRFNSLSMTDWDENLNGGLEEDGQPSPSRGFSTLTVQQVIAEALKSNTKMNIQSKKKGGLRVMGETTKEVGDPPILSVISI